MADMLLYDSKWKTEEIPAEASFLESGRYDAPGAFRVSTDYLPERERFSLWCKASRPTGVEAAPLADHPFQVEPIVRELPGLRIMFASGSPRRATRTKKLVADRNDNLCLTINFGSDATLLREGRELSIAPRTAVLIPHADEVTYIHSDRILSFIASRASLAARLSSVDCALGRLIPHDSDALQLLATYAQTVVMHSVFTTPALRETAAAHIRDLMVLAIAASQEARPTAGAHGARAARLRALRADVVKNMSRPDFSIAGLADAHSLSPRQVQRLFEESGTTFTQFVLDERLALARRLLEDPAHGRLAIAVIALESGFSDLSYFNRRFRHRYGCTPTDIRAAA